MRAGVFVLAFLFAAGVLSAGQADMSDRAILDRAAAYVADYQTQLTYVLADEDTVQTRTHAAMPDVTRSTKSEVFFVVTPVERQWLAVRQVIEVDGKPVANRRDMRALLAGNAVAGVEAILREENSRYNIGRVARNFNEPTLNLLMFMPRFRPQFKFKRKKSELVDGGTLVRFEFSEAADGPTIVRGHRGPAPSSGEVEIDAATGRVERTHLKLKTGTLRAEQSTIYGRDDRLNLWVPTKFDETYEETATGLKETIECRTRYANYRRFEVNVIIR